METPRPIEVRAVLYEDRGVWVAQCLEYDIAAFSESLRGLPKAFSRTVAAYLSANADQGRAGLEGIPPAPPRFVAMYEGSDLDLSSRGASGEPIVKADLRVAEAA